MVINTKEISTRIKLAIMIGTLVYSALLVASLVFVWSPKHYFEIISSIIFVSLLLFIAIKKFYYIYYNGDGTKIIMRWSSLLPLSVGKYAIEIPKRDFIRAEFKKEFLGLRTSLIIFVSTPQGVAKFKPISLSTLSKREIIAIEKELKIFESSF